MKTHRHPAAELLEARIAPAAIIVNYTDFDGDLVSVTASKPGAVAPPLDSGDFDFVAGGTGQLAALSVNEAGFDGASIVFTVQKVAGGDGRAHVGFLNAAGVDLDRVVVKGDLGKIVAGDATTSGDPGLNLLDVRSMGEKGLTTQGGTGDLLSVVTGKLGALNVDGDFRGAFLQVIGGVDGKLGSLFIGGDLRGGSLGSSGAIFSEGKMGDVRVRGHVVTGTGPNSGFTGRITSNSTMGDVNIGGELIGGEQANSGWISSVGRMGDVKIGGGITGGAGVDSGEVSANGMGNVFIGLGLRGSPSLSGMGTTRSGVIESLGTMGAVTIRGDVEGGVLANSGIIHSVGRMASLSIEGSLLGGANSSSGSVSADAGITGLTKIAGKVKGGNGAFGGTLTIGGATPSGAVEIGGSLVGDLSATSGGIRFNNINSVGTSLTIKGSVSGGIITGNDIGTIAIGGSMTSGFLSFSGKVGAISIGKDLGTVATGVTIAIEGHEAAAGQPGTAIGSLKVGGSVFNSTIQAGTSIAVATNPDAQIGSVKVGGNWTASSLVAGVLSGSGTDFGDGDDALIFQPGEPDAFFSKIGKIVIAGSVSGTAAAGDHFGFVAQKIGKLKIGAKNFDLTSGNLLIPGTDDVRAVKI